MSDQKSRRDTLINQLTAARLKPTDRDRLMASIAMAVSDTDLQQVEASLQDLIAARKPRSTDICGKINDHLGIIRLSGKAAYLIKNRAEWSPNTLVEVWYNAADAKEYLLRKGVEVLEKVQDDNGKTITLDHFKAWRCSSSADEFAGVIYHPDGPARYQERFNLWNGWGAAPLPGDKHQRFLDLLREGFCAGNATYYDYVLNWLAHLLQKPQERPGTAIAIVSGQGAGKGTLIEILTAMIGEKNCSGDISNKDLGGNFNSKIANRLLINLNEATFSGNHEQVEFMKKLITDPTFRVEYKGLEAFDAPNFSRLIVTTNNSNWGRLAIDDRRYLVLEPKEGYPGDREFFTALRREMFEEGGVAHLAHFLRQRNIADWVPAVLPPRVTGLDTLEDSMKSRSDLFFFYELAGFGQIDGMTVNGEDSAFCCGAKPTFSAFFQAYEAYCSRHRRMEPVAKSKFSIFANKLGCCTIKRNNVTHIKLLEQGELRKAIEAEIKSVVIPWSERFPEARDEEADEAGIPPYAMARAVKLGKGIELTH